MSLNKITLTAIAVANMYKYSLVNFENITKIPVQTSGDIQFFGGNNKHILIMVDNEREDFLPGNQLTFLSGILDACKLKMEDIAIVNINKIEKLKLKEIPNILMAKTIILFGIELSILELPFKIPSFQVQQYKGTKYVSIPLLYTIQNDPALKRKLWELLKVLFIV